MHVLVTGAAGFLGRYIVEQLLARGDRVRAFCRRDDPGLRALGAEVVVGDIRDRAAVVVACEGMDCVIHTAAIAGLWGPWSEFHAINVLGTRNVIEACLAQGVARLVFTSSPSVTFDGTDQKGVDESAEIPVDWLANYPRSKAAAEQEVLLSNGLVGVKGPLLACALRPHLIWGPRDRHLVPRLWDRARRGQLRRIGDGRNLIDMVYVENAAAAHLQAADALVPRSAVAGKAYFISQGEPVNCWQWIDELLALAGLPPVNKSISAGAAWRLGAVLETVHRLLRLSGEPRMTRFLAAQLSTSHYFDITAARQDFGYSPAISTAEGMRRLQAFVGDS
jgi:nucleoside-diphosphate-sugar epimerase